MWTKSIMRSVVLAVILCFWSAPIANSQDSAPSSHLVFDDDFDGDILVNEVRVPRAGQAMYTYYETLGWRGKGAGYAGIQVHPKAHLFIFSIWDHKEHTAPIKAVYHGPGTETVGFGGEGTGLKSWNFQLGWDPDTWYTLVSRAWPVDDHTYYGFWTRSDKTKNWTHMVTMDVAVPEARFRGGTDAFIEDWSSTGKNARTIHLRRGWKRKMDGTWYPFNAARYSVNKWDLDPGKRSYKYRKNWNAGTASDQTGDYYFMVSGGADTTATTTNPAVLVSERKDTKPDYAKCKIENVRVSSADKTRGIVLRWEIAAMSTPQFAYEIAIFDNPDCHGQPLTVAAGRIPHARKATLDASSINVAQQEYFVRLKCIDILGRESNIVIEQLN